MKHRRCTKCKKLMELDKFNNTSTVCMECRDKRIQEIECTRLEKEEVRKRNIEQMWWLKCTPEEIAERKRKTRQEARKRNADTIKAYRKSHKEEENARKREDRKNNPEKYKEIKKRYYMKHPDAKKEIKKLSNHRREAKQKLLPFSFTGKEWNICRDSFDNKCCYCGKEVDLQQDHFVPLAKNGEYTKNNIVPACPSCNVSKSDKDFFEWYPQQSFYSKKRERAIMKYLNYQGEFQQIAM